MHPASCILVEKRRRAWESAIVGLFYALAVAMMTLPASLRPAERVIGHSLDTWIFYWNDWWLERAIAEGRNWFISPYNFYPLQTNLLVHANSFLSSLTALPLRPLVGPVAAYNLVVLIELWIGALGAFLLTRDLTHRPAAAVLAGFAFAFAPYHLSQRLSHAHLGSIHWWPFYALFLRRALQRPRIADALWAGLFAALTLWAGFQPAVLLALWTVAYVGWRALFPLKLRRWAPRAAGMLALTALVAAILSAPILWPVIRGWRQVTDTKYAVHESMDTQTDLLAYLTPPSYHPLFGPRVAVRYQKELVANWECMPYLGYTVIALALLSALRGARDGGERQRRWEALFWPLSALAWMVIAAGPAPRINGVLYPAIPLPYRIIENVFPISLIRSSDRFNLLTAFSISIAAGLGAGYLVERRRWLLAPLLLATAFEFLSCPIPTLEPPYPSPFLDRMAQDGGNYAVLHYPMGYTAGKVWLAYQTIHGKPIVEGHVSRYTFENYIFITSQPLLRAFYQTAQKPHYLLDHQEIYGAPLPLAGLGPALHDLDRVGVRYILFHKLHMTPLWEEQFRRLMPLPPIYEDDTLAVYDTARPLPVCYDGLPAELASDVALARFDAARGDGGEWRVQVIAVPLSPRRAPLDCQIELTGEESPIVSRPLSLFPLSGGATWEAGVLSIAQITATLPSPPEAGAYRWRLSCGAGGDYLAPDIWEIQPDGRSTYLRRRVDVRYGDSIALRGYRWRTEGATLQISLLWEALQPPAAEYKVFIHLLDAQNQIVGQSDAMPCQWSCPTGAWRSGQVILDRGDIPLRALSPGEYRLAVGLYHEATGQRLTARGPTGERYADDRYLLPDPFIITIQRITGTD